MAPPAEPPRDEPAFRRALLAWHRRAGRDFPWRRTADPYAVWVSEVMLQQTTVAAVAPRYLAFLARFPTVAALAAAAEQAVLQAWEGLGYYRRARLLHAAARQVCERHGGAVPTDPEVLRSLPGLGRYAANAVASFAAGACVPILEANTVRVWARQRAIPGDPARQPALGQLWEAAAEALPPRGSAGPLNQALMDLGALVCTPAAPRCGECPVAAFCAAHAAGRTADFPQRPVRTPVELRREAALLLWRNGRVLVRQRSAAGRWPTMWEFPVVEVPAGADPATLAAAAAPGVPLTLRLKFSYTVMRWRVALSAFEGHAAESATVPAGEWLRPAELADRPFATPQRRLARAALAGPASPGRF